MPDTALVRRGGIYRPFRMTETAAASLIALFFTEP